MSEMKRFEEELTKLEPERIEDEEFRKKLYNILMKEYEKKRRKVLNPLFKLSIALGIFLLILIPLYLHLSPRMEKSLPPKKGEKVVSLKRENFPLIEKLTESDELMSEKREGEKTTLIYKSGLKIVKLNDEIVSISYGEKYMNFDIEEEKSEYLGLDIDRIKEIMERDKRVNFLIKEGRIVEGGRIDENLLYVILDSFNRRWRVIVDLRNKKVVSFFSPP